jgi:hypothetical protein
VIFLFFEASILALWPTQPFIQWVAKGVLPGEPRPKHEADHIYPSTKVKNVGVISPIPYTSSRRAQGQLYLLYFPLQVYVFV